MQYTSLLFVLVISVIAIFRLRKRIAGGIVNKNRIILATILYFATSALAVFGSFQIGVSLWYLVVYAVALTGSAYLSSKLVNDKITIWKTDDGLVHAKGGNIPYIIWIAGLLSRFAIGYTFIGSDYLNIYSTQKIMDSSTILVIMIVDVIMMIGVGSLIGRNIHLLSKIKTRKIN